MTADARRYKELKEQSDRKHKEVLADGIKAKKNERKDEKI